MATPKFYGKRFRPGAPLAAIYASETIATRLFAGLWWRPTGDSFVSVSPTGRLGTMAPLTPATLETAAATGLVTQLEPSPWESATSMAAPTVVPFGIVDINIHVADADLKKLAEGAGSVEAIVGAITRVSLPGLRWLIVESAGVQFNELTLLNPTAITFEDTPEGRSAAEKWLRDQHKGASRGWPRFATRATLGGDRSREKPWVTELNKVAAGEVARRSKAAAEEMRALQEAAAQKKAEREAKLHGDTAGLNTQEFSEIIQERMKRLRGRTV